MCNHNYNGNEAKNEKTDHIDTTLMKLGLVMDTNMSLSMIMVIYINPFHATKLF